MDDHVIQRFVGIPGHRVANIHFLDSEGHTTDSEEAVQEVVIELARVQKPFHCACGREFHRYYDVREQMVRDLPWGPWASVWVLVPRFRVVCPECGVRTERLDWIPAGCQHTRRLAQAVALACREVRSIQAIAEAFGLSWNTVRDIDKAALESELNPPKLDGLRYLAIDEFSIRRHHTYGTIFLDAERNKVLWVCATRQKEAVVNVFRNVFGPEVCKGIKAVSMDWWGPYEEAVKECLPQANVVWDQFHVVKKYNRDVVDRIRLDEANRCQTPQERRAMKKSKFILLKNRRNLVEDEPARLRELLAANRSLLKVYVCRDLLKVLWQYKYSASARKWFHGWYQRAMHSKLEPLKKFARALKERLEGLLSHCRYPISNGVLEGIDNKVKVIKRVAYGFRDYDYFFLKIRAHFPGPAP